MNIMLGGNGGHDWVHGDILHIIVFCLICGKNKSVKK